MGSDQHRYQLGTGIVIGGVKIPAEYAVVAHSDGDVLLHALTDALLGAVAAGDIGELFADSAAENLDRDSRDFVTAAERIVRDRGFEIVNIDSTIQAERPKLSGYKSAIAASIAEILGLENSAVSVKAKTAEGMDALGRCEGIRAEAVVLIKRIEENV